MYLPHRRTITVFFFVVKQKRKNYRPQLISIKEAGKRVFPVEQRLKKEESASTAKKGNKGPGKEKDIVGNE